MIDIDYYKAWNINDRYEIKQEVLAILNELEEFDKRIKKFLGPNKVKSAGKDARRSCREIERILAAIKKKIQMTKQDYESDYSED
ncbi:MAG: hypothetical protein AABY15_04690 [Nanoarchaeota archaeon]